METLCPNNRTAGTLLSREDKWGAGCARYVHQSFSMDKRKRLREVCWW